MVAAAVEMDTAPTLVRHAARSVVLVAVASNAALEQMGVPPSVASVALMALIAVLARSVEHSLDGRPAVPRLDVSESMIQVVMTLESPLLL